MSSDWQTFYNRNRLRERLDAAGDLAPPWEQFPTYERYSIGWRMGGGEDWMMYWHVFLEDLAPTFDVRLAYLRRHPPAPVPWADFVYRTLYPSDEDSQNEDAAVEAGRRTTLSELGLIASDVAYPTWLAQQSGVRWPWEYAATPVEAARYWMRDFAFWSRQVAELRRDPTWEPPAVPVAWQSCDEPLRTGRVHDPDVRQGLLTLAQMLAASRVTPPWELGLTLADFTNTFDNSMGYVDAFRLWIMCSFDDREQEQQYLSAHNTPSEWRDWFVEKFQLS